jgi:pyridoxamine 5'-phosphate oxidase
VAELRRADLAEDPLEQFRRWFEEARPVVRLPEAMAVATAAPDGGPSVRMLLLKAADERGFVFFTGYVSRKGAELDANPRAALLFYWDPLGRQVRVEGTVQRVPAAESDEYFATRPQGSRLGAAASRQSAVLASRAELERAVGKLAAAADESVRRPSTWGGYRPEKGRQYRYSWSLSCRIAGRSRCRIGALADDVCGFGARPRAARLPTGL